MKFLLCLSSWVIFFTVVFAEGSPLIDLSELVSVSRLIPVGFVIELPLQDNARVPEIVSEILGLGYNCAFKNTDRSGLG